MGKQKVMTLYERALEEGIEQGIEKGVELGRLQGEFRKALDTAKRLQEKNFSISEIQEITGLSERELKDHGILTQP